VAHYRARRAERERRFLSRLAIGGESLAVPGDVDISDPATSIVTATVRCVLRRNKFRFGHSVQAI
jgi:hypothetical protein